MDSEVSVVPLAKCLPGVPPSNIHTELSEDYNRRHLPTNESNIDRIWELCEQQNPKLYNGSKFRFHSINVNTNSSRVTLRLGLTGYKDFIGTNRAENASELLEAGSKDFSDSQAYMSDALGLGAFVQTADDCAIFIQRSLVVGEAEGLWDRPGGHAEPAMVKGGSAKMEDMTLSDLSELDVKNELIDSVIREIRDELNIPESKLDEPHLMGLVKNLTSAGRTSTEFYVRCSLPSTEIEKLYSAGGAEAEESTEIKFIPLSDIHKLDRTEMWKEMAPAGRGCVKLYSAMSIRPP